MGRQLALQALAVLLVLTVAMVSHPASRLAPGACAALQAGDGAALQDCLDSLPAGAALALPPRRIVLTHPVTLHRRLALSTAGVAATAPRCPEDGAGCAVIALQMADGAGPPVTLAGAGTTLDHLVLTGTRGDPARPNDAATCRSTRRALMGGLSIKAPGISVTASVLRDMTCFSAAVAEPGADGLRFTNNAVVANGTHDIAPLWSDGLTVIDATNDVIRGNLFRDNTDVQLVLGGCLRCTVAGNQFVTTAAPSAAAFAALLVHGWPHSSGDYSGTAITGNSIDCGPAHGCGFGIGVGGRAWYPSAASGGAITGNQVRRAAIGINVNDATGPVAMADNAVTESGGSVQTHCGPRTPGPVNITANSARYVDATAGVAMPAEAVTRLDFAGCLPGLK